MKLSRGDRPANKSNAGGSVDGAFMIALLRSKRKLARFERGLWIIIGLMSSLPLSAVLMENPSELFMDFRMVFFVFFYGIATIGLVFNWGPIVPCTILGIVILRIFTDPIASSYEEAAFDDYVIPTMGSITGAIFGLMIDWILTHPPTIEPNPNDIQDDESKQSST